MLYYWAITSQAIEHPRRRLRHQTVAQQTHAALGMAKVRYDMYEIDFML